MSAKDPDWPVVRSGLPKEVMAEFRKRSKAIKYRVSNWDIIVSDDEEFERLDMDFNNYGIQTRLSVWGNGTLWFRVCRGGKNGWDLNYSFHAWAESSSAPQIREAFEDSLDFLESEEDVRSIWQAFHPD